MANAPNQSQPQAAPAAPAAPGTAPAPVAEAPQQQLPVDGSYYKNGRITRAGMESVIKSGGTVIHSRTEGTGDNFRVVEHRHIARAEDIPSAAHLANTPEEKAAARQQLQAEQQRLNDQLAQLDEGDGGTAKSAKK